MARRKRKTELQDAFDAIAGFRDLVDEIFERLAGKPITAWFEEFRQRPRELPPIGPSWPPEPKVRQPIATEPGMPLVDAYAILGLPQTASLEEVKKRYRDMARLFHPDAPGGYKEAMVLLNNAYDRIKREKKE